MGTASRPTTDLTLEQCKKWQRPSLKRRQPSRPAQNSKKFGKKLTAISRLPT